VSLAPRIQLRSRITGIEKRLGGQLLDSDYCVLATDDVDIFKADGTPLLFLRRGAIPEKLANPTRTILRDLAKRYGSNNRSKYAGASRVVKVDVNGVKSKNSQSKSVESAIIGYIDRMGGRFPYCRQTAFTAGEVAKWNDVVPLAQHVAKLFAENVPDRYRAQKEIADKTPSEYVIAKTPFTTITVNHNIAGRLHTDKGDYGPGFGCISVFREGTYKGGILCFPAYKVAVDLNDRDVIFFDPHEIHGVTDFTDTSADFSRVSVVYYYREKMHECLPAKEELARAKTRGGV